MAAIAKYKVGLSRSGRRAPTRWLTLVLDKPDADLRQVSLFFYDGEPPNVGFINRATGSVVGNLRSSDFDVAYHLLQTEKPLFVHWRVDAEEDRLLAIDLSTSEEPLGEGAPDTSP